MASHTLADIARLTGVSSMTVSKVVNNQPGISAETRERVMQVVQELGYLEQKKSVRGLNTGLKQILGVVVPTLGSQHISEIVRGIGSVAYRAGFDMLIHTSVNDEGAHENERVSFLAHGLVDGLLLVLPRTLETYLPALEAARLPVVVIDPDRSTAPFCSVLSNNYQGARDAMSHLISLGHRRIAYLSGWTNHLAGEARLQGYREGLLTAGLEVDTDLIRYGDYTQLTAFALASELFSLIDPPTAVFAANDYSAFGVIDAAKNCGRHVPEDVSIVGFDNIPMAEHIYPSLTTVQQPQAEMGKTAAKLLLSLLDGGETLNETIRLDTRLIVRASTAPPTRTRKDKSHGL